MIKAVGIAVIGIVAGLLGGLLGLGGGTVVIPGLIFLFGFSQKKAQGTTLMMMVPPIGILAAIEYYRAGEGSIIAAAILAAAFIIGEFLGAKVAVKLNSDILRKIFAVYIAAIAVRMFFG